MMNEEIPKNMKKCPTCGTLVAKSAKVCPSCGAKLKNSTLLIVIIVVVVFLCICCCGGIAISKSSDSNKKATEISSSNDSSDNSSNTNDSTSDNSSSDTSKSSSDVSYEITDTRFEWYTNSIGSKEYYGIVEITNTGNSNLYLKDCTFDMEDDTGHLLQSDDFIYSGPDVIAPNEKGYFYNSLGSSSLNDGVSTDNGVNLVPQVNIVKATSDAVNLEVTDTELKYNSDYPVVTGRVVNSTSEEQNVDVQVIFYDSNNKVIAIDSTSVYNVPANGKSSFEYSGVFMNDKITSDKIASYVVKAQADYYQW